MNKIGVMLEAFQTEPLKALTLAREAGADAVQFYAGVGPLDLDRLSLSERRAFEKALQKSGLEISAVDVYKRQPWGRIGRLRLRLGESESRIQDDRRTSRPTGKSL